MTNKVAFFYLHGTDPLIAQVAAIVGGVFNQARTGLLTVPGLNGLTATWLDGAPRNDAFPNLLDPNIFEAKMIGYPAMNLPMGLSINIGINNMVAAITALPKGQKFAIGGYSQGAACAASVMLRLRSTGDLYASRGADFLGGVCFGSPRRQTDYRGEVGGTWSGSWDVDDSTTGGRGIFSPTGPFPRLTNCEPDKWIEFTDYDDIMSSHGISQVALNATQASNAFLNITNLQDVFTAIGNPFDPANTLLDDWNTTSAIASAGVNTFTDFVGKTFQVGGAGHTAYPWRPPPGDPDNGLTSYQIAVKWLTGKANAYAVGSDVLPAVPTSTSTAGWTTTLIPPAA